MGEHSERFPVAFQTVTRSHPTRDPIVRIFTARAGAPAMRLSVGLREQMGQPAGVQFQYDPDDNLLRIVAASPDDRDAYKIPLGHTGEFVVRDLISAIGYPMGENAKFAAVNDGPGAAIVDLNSPLPDGTLTYRSTP